MTNQKRTLCYFLALGFTALINVGCTSVPPTQYYTLVSEKYVANKPITNDADFTQTAISAKSIGIGPLVIPNSLESFSVTSVEKNNQIIISPYHLWAGNLKTNMTQVLADNISHSLQQDSVWPFPWDNRNRPKIQVRVVFERFMGELGKEIQLQAKWTILDEYGRKEIKTEKTIIMEALMTSSYLNYVTTLNDALNQLSLVIADELKKM